MKRWIGAVGALAVVAAAGAGGPAAAQLVKDGPGKVCGGYIWQKFEHRVAACTMIVDGADRTDKEKAWALAYRAGAYLETGRQLDLALADADRAVKLWPQYTHAYVVRGTTLGALRRGPEALADLDKAIGMGAGYAAYYGRGLTHRWMGEYAQTLSDMEQALKLMPGSIDALAVRADAYGGLGRYEEAARSYSAALQGARSSERLRVGRAWAYGQLRQYDKAFADLDLLVAEKKAGLSTWLLRGRLRNDAKAYPLAVADFRAAVAAAPDNREAARLLAGALVDAGQVAEGEAVYAEALGRWPDDAVIRNERCWIRTVAGRDLDGALADCDRAVTLDPKDAAYLDSRGFLRFRRGEDATAIADLDKALALDPKSAPSLYIRGLAKARTGGDGAADLAAARALRADIAAEYEGYGVKAGEAAVASASR